MPKKLPTNPSIENLKNQAKALLKAHKQGLSKANERIQKFHPKWSRNSVEQIQNANLSLSDAQWIIAREYGFSSWAKLRKQIESQEHRRTLTKPVNYTPGQGWISAGERHLTKEYHDWIHQQIGEILQVINFAKGQERVVLQRKFDVLKQELIPTTRIREYIQRENPDSSEDFLYNRSYGGKK